MIQNLQSLRHLYDVKIEYDVTATGSGIMTEASRKRKCKFESRENLVTLENLFDFKFTYKQVCITQKENDLQGLQASYK